MTNTIEQLIYREEGNYLLPNLTVPDKRYEIGKYGMMRRTYLKKYRPGLYTAMLVKGTLLQHLEDADKAATAMVDRIIAKMAKADGVTEEMKYQNPLQWTGLMNNYKHSAEEIIMEMLFD